MSKPTLFDFIKQITSKTEKHEYDKKIAPAYMLSQWLSHDSNLIDKVNDINMFQFILPDEIVYQYYRSTIPKGKRFIKWVKKRKEEKTKEIIKKIKEHHPNLSERECKMVITWLRKR